MQRNAAKMNEVAACTGLGGTIKEIKRGKAFSAFLSLPLGAQAV